MNHNRRILAAAGLAVALLLVMALTMTNGWGLLLFPAAAVLVGGAFYRRRLGAAPVRQQVVGRHQDAALRSAQPLTLLAQLQSLTPAQFEEFTRLLFAASGLYHNVQRQGASGDGGIDVLMYDGAGNRCVVQCKRYKGTLSPQVVRDLLGVMTRNKAREGYLVTTGRVSHDAKAWAAGHKLHVWDGEVLLSYAHRWLGDSLDETIRRARL